MQIRNNRRQCRAMPTTFSRFNQERSSERTARTQCSDEYVYETLLQPRKTSWRHCKDIFTVGPKKYGMFLLKRSVCTCSRNSKFPGNVCIPFLSTHWLKRMMFPTVLLGRRRSRKTTHCNASVQRGLQTSRLMFILCSPSPCVLVLSIYLCDTLSIYLSLPMSLSLSVSGSLAPSCLRVYTPCSLWPYLSCLSLPMGPTGKWTFILEHCSVMESVSS